MFFNKANKKRPIRLTKEAIRRFYNKKKDR